VTQTSASNAAHCLDLVKTNNLDRYLSTLLADIDYRQALFAIYAFDAEVSGITRQVSEPVIGEIRLQWWRETLEHVFEGECDPHPIAKELQTAVHKHALPKHLFTRLIDARQFDLYDEPMGSTDDLITYTNNTATAITDLAAQILIGEEVKEISSLIEKAGIAHGLGKLLSDLPVNTSQKKCYLPADILVKHDLNFKNVLAGEYSTKMQLVISQLCHMVEEQLNQIRHVQKRLKKPVLPAFYPASLAGLTVKKYAAGTHNPLKQPLNNSQLKIQWHLLKCALFGRL